MDIGPSVPLGYAYGAAYMDNGTSMLENCPSNKLQEFLPAADKINK